MGKIAFEIEKIYNRKNDLHHKYGGRRQSGIAPCANYPLVFLFTAPAGKEFGYEDGWLSEDDYRYTGEGQTGNMEMIRGNSAIRDHQKDGRALHLFKKASSGMYAYQGEFAYQSHEIVRGEDAEGKNRDVIRFVLRKI